MAEQEAAEKLRVEEAEKERQAVDAQTARRERYRVVNQAVVRLGFDIKSPTADVAGGRGSLGGVGRLCRRLSPCTWGHRTRWSSASR